MNPLHPNDLTGVVLDRNSAWIPTSLEIPFDEPDESFSDATDHLYSLTGFPEPAYVGTKEFYSSSIEAGSFSLDRMGVYS